MSAGRVIELALLPLVLHPYVLALEVAGFALAKCGGKGRVG